jgi:predicted ATPase
MSAGAANDRGEEMLDFRQVQQQLRFAFRKFFRAVGAFGPVVLAMDDLQWADAASMELLESLALDRENASLMIVASFRDDDAYSQCPHITSLENLRTASEHDPSLQLMSVCVGDLRVEQVNELLVDLLSSPSPATTEGLAEIVHKKTSGNVFFVIQFLTVLQESQLLAFNFGAMKWVWDVEEVRLSTAATDNVVSLLKKMRSLPGSVGFVLPIMACLGSTFHEPVLAVVVDRVGPPQDEGSTDVPTILKGLGTSVSFLRHASKKVLSSRGLWIAALRRISGSTTRSKKAPSLC